MYADDRRKKLRVGGYGVVVCPYNTCIVETCYRGYSRFDLCDVYDLVAEWNRPFLKNIYKKVREIDLLNHRYSYYVPQIIIETYQERGEEETQKLVNSREDKNSSFRTEWKRNIGIDIACEPEHNVILPYPIKIASALGYIYKELKPSYRVII